MGQSAGQRHALAQGDHALPGILDSTPERSPKDSPHGVDVWGAFPFCSLTQKVIPNKAGSLIVRLQEFSRVTKMVVLYSVATQNTWQDSTELP